MARKTGVWSVVAVVAMVAAGCGGAGPRHHVRPTRMGPHAQAATSMHGPATRSLERQLRRFLSQHPLGPLVPRRLPPVLVPGGPDARPLPGGRPCLVAAGAGSCSIQPCVVYAQGVPAVELGTVVRIGQ